MLRIVDLREIPRYVPVDTVLLRVHGIPHLFKVDWYALQCSMDGVTFFSRDGLCEVRAVCAYRPARLVQDCTYVELLSRDAGRGVMVSQAVLGASHG